MTGAYQLYGGGISRSVAVQVVLEELALPYELLEVDLRRDRHRSPEFLRVNPAGFVPALVTPDGLALHENAAIMLWLADVHPEAGLAPDPGDRRRGLFLSKLFYHSNDIQPAVKRYFYPHRYSPDAGAVPAIRARAHDAALERWSVLNRHLEENGPCHLGDRFSLLEPHMAVWAAYGLGSTDEVLDRFSAVRRCFELAVERPRSGALILEFQRKVRAWREGPSDQ